MGVNHHHRTKTLAIEIPIRHCVAHHEWTLFLIGRSYRTSEELFDNGSTVLPTRCVFVCGALLLSISALSRCIVI